MPAERPGHRDPALELLASNPYEHQLDAYRAALDLDGEHPLLDDPYSEARLLANPYENWVGLANPYVDAIRNVDGQVQARLDNPDNERLRAAKDVSLEKPVFAAPPIAPHGFGVGLGLWGADERERKFVRPARDLQQTTGTRTSSLPALSASLPPDRAA